MKSTIDKKANGEVEIKIVVETSEFEAYHARGLKKIQDMVEVDGFRKGNAPEKEIVKKFGEMIILEETANICLGDMYASLLSEHKLFPIVEPKVIITKLAAGNPFEASITLFVLPEITLPSYKKIAQAEVKEKQEEVKNEEVHTVLSELQKGRAGKESIDAHVHGEECNHDEVESVEEKETKDTEVALPTLDDAFAQSFGEEFKSLDDLKAKIKENLSLEKKQKAQEMRRTKIMEAIVKEAKAELSDVIIESELNRMIGQMSSDVSRFGGTFAEYLSHAGKTEEGLRKDWRDDASRRALSQLVLMDIAKEEKITPSDEEIDVELMRLKQMMPNIDENRARDYVYQALINEKVLLFLENV